MDNPKGSSNDTRLNQLKKELYLALISLPPDKLSDSDVDIVFELSRDPAIQIQMGNGLKAKED